jgi:hypothetical protein
LSLVVASVAGYGSSTSNASNVLTDMARGRLFDSVPRYGGPALYSEPHFTFLNRADSPAWQRVRDLAEAWYAEHPDPDGDLRARFRNVDIHQHAPAWWELYTYSLFRRLGYAIMVHPTIPGASGRPDFLVTKDGSKAYVECVVLFADGSRRSTDSESWLKDCIDAARNPDFMVSIRFEHFGSRRPKKRQVTRQIEDWLASLDYDSVRAASSMEGFRAQLPTTTFDFADSRVRLKALPVHPDKRGHDMGRIGIGPGSGAFVIESVDEIRSIVRGKAKQCRGVDAPLIVAILNWTTFATPVEVEEALFGSAAVRHNGTSAYMIRAEDGYWHPGPPPRGSSISAIMFGEHIHTSRIVAELPSLWLNPWTHKPITYQLPFETHTAYDTGEVLLAMEATTSPELIFELPRNWPGF